MRFRSVLFVPGDRPDLAAKAPRAKPDAIALDLEDGVGADGKAAAREMVGALAVDLAAAGVSVLLRVNPPGTEWCDDDLRLFPMAGVAGVMVPKLDRVDHVESVAGALAGVPIVAGLETVRGVADAREVLGGPVGACYFGAEDYVADLGGVRTPGNAEVAVARSMVAIAARLAGVPAFDQVVLDFGDTARFTAEAAEARALGYAGKVCIHPAQVPLANECFLPSAAERDRAARLLAAYDAALADGRATCAFDGTMVDEVIARQARAVLAAGQPG